ncbi:hypothetical protein VTJ83DRAFT_952 [Remersonia thermophila]|uniref:Thiamine-binding protein domain-containing protein n=1 Tax=Remersonia thermophila TaxID=72144 RepID=A0ABR4DNE8_9PEZI
MKSILRASIRASARRSVLPRPRTLGIRSISTSTMNATDYSKLPTPASCYVDFCLVPIGTGSVSVAKEVAEVQKVLKASGVKHTLHSAGTTVEGSWDEVMEVIGKCHSAVHQMGDVRIQTAMRVGSRIDKPQTAEEKIKRVQDLLAEDGKSP